MSRLRSDDSNSLTIKLALPSPTSERGYNVPRPAIHWLDDDILLGIFNCYRLDEKNSWNDRLGWRNLSQVCQRWRYLIYESAFHLGMHVQCTKSSLMVNTLDHLPPLPLIIQYYLPTVLEQDESGIFHTLRLHHRIHHMDLSLPPSIFNKALALMNENFPILEYLFLSADSGQHLPLTLPKGFLAPNLRHLTLSGISLPKRLRVLTSTVSLVTLRLSSIQTSRYFRPRLLVARLRSLPLLEELTIEFSTPIPRPSTESELLGEGGAPVTLPSLKTLSFHGVGAYLESLVAQIKVPLLEKLSIRLFNQIALVLPHLFYLISITEVFKFSSATITFNLGVYHPEVSISMNHDLQDYYLIGPFRLAVKCKPVDWQIDCAAQICHGLIPTLFDVEGLWLKHAYLPIPTEMRNGAIDSATWHDLLRSFIGLKKLYIGQEFLEELSRALQVDEVASDPSFLPNLQSICASDNPFTSFINTRNVVGRPVQFETYPVQ